MLFLEYIFWIALFLLIHTYLLYPLLLNFIGKNKSQNKTVFDYTDDLPTISILLAVYNEEQVIREKIETTFKTNYPQEKIQFLIGSDACTDKTENIINEYIEKYSNLTLVPFGGRTGKPQIINELQKRTQSELLVITDANVFFDEDTLYQLCKHYKNKEIGLVGGNIVNINLKSDGISKQEDTYLKGENRVKYLEGTIWGALMGVFGGVYSIRNNLFEPVPSKFTVDDFYITLAVIEKQNKAILELDAIAYEDVSNQLDEEFRRKVRISKGNYQNLIRFKKIVLNPFKGAGFAFFSHKFLRWVGPFLMILMLGCSGFLMNEKNIYKVAFIGEISFMVLPFVDSCLKAFRINIKVLRFVTHFVWMNLALLKGFFHFLTGVKTNIWTPTQRYQ